MEATFKLDGCNTLRIANNIALPDEFGNAGRGQFLGRDTVLILNEYHGCNAPGTEPPPVKVTVLATLKHSNARALGSILLAAAADAKDGV